jgi:GntR family transcriptional regulator
MAAIGATITSTMLDVKVDRSDPALLHDQVAGEIRRAIADGEARPGERLPPARDLAAVLGVNTNTVLRALRLLRDEGLLEFRRGRGIHVAGDAVPKSAVLAKAHELVEVARREGYRSDDLIELIGQLA